MASGQPRLLDRLRQPEYTGSNRCLPCTAVNLVIAGALTIAVAVVSLPAAPVVFALAVVTIYFRGYLVPGTPTLTKRYFPDWLLAKFDKAPDSTTIETPTEDATPADADADAHGPAGADPERVFLDHDILVPCRPAAGSESESESEANPEDEADLCLTDPIRDAWRTEIDSLRDGDREHQVATFLDTDAGDVLVDQTSGRVLVRVDGRLAARWESDAALLADLAADRVLAEHLPQREQRSLQSRSQLANGLRAFVEACPACEGPVSLDEETVESCCRSQQVYAITCEDCDARILEVPQ